MESEANPGQGKIVTLSARFPEIDHLPQGERNLMLARCRKSEEIKAHQLRWAKITKVVTIIMAFSTAGLAVSSMYLKRSPFWNWYWIAPIVVIPMFGSAFLLDVLQSNGRIAIYHALLKQDLEKARHHNQGR